jgi:hypothetical protein
MFFENIPQVNYNIDGDIYNMENITISVNPVDDLYNDRYFDVITIQEQTPEELSDELYKNPMYHWVLLYVNRIVNPFDEWVIPIEALDEYCINKYGSQEALLEPNYFYDVVSDQVLVGVDFTKALEHWQLNKEPPDGVNVVTNLEYEQRLNDKKRVIRVVPPRKLLSFVDAYQSAMGGAYNEIR